jgi:hypothetical protein
MFVVQNVYINRSKGVSYAINFRFKKYVVRRKKPIFRYGEELFCWMIAEAVGNLRRYREIPQVFKVPILEVNIL